MKYLLSNIILRSISILTTLLTVYIMARLVSPNDVGIFLRLGVLQAFLVTILDIAVFPTLLSSAVNGLLNITVLKNLLKTLFKILIPLIIVISAYWINNDGSSLLYILLMIIILALSICSVILNAYLSANNRLANWSQIIIISECTSIYLIYNLSTHISDGVILFSMRFIIVNCLMIGLSTVLISFTSNLRNLIIRHKAHSQIGNDLFIFAISNYFTRYFDTTIISFVFSGTALGIYNRAMQISRYPQIAIVSALSQILLPFLQKYNVTKSQIALRASYFHLYFMVCNVVSIILILNAEIYVRLILGPKWVDAVPLLPFFFSTLTMQTYLGLTNSLFVHFEETQAYRNLGILSSVSTTILILYSIQFGDLTYIAIAFVFSITISFFASFIYLMHKILKLTILQTGLLILNAIIPLMYFGLVS
jgi:O-antigen/teichoic acid export membrane protein